MPKPSIGGDLTRRHIANLPEVKRHAAPDEMGETAGNDPFVAFGQAVHRGLFAQHRHGVS